MDGVDILLVFEERGYEIARTDLVAEKRFRLILQIEVRADLSGSCRLDLREWRRAQLGDLPVPN
jgi:hypothetical protein